MTRPFTLSWLAGCPDARTFLALHFLDPAARKAAVTRAARPIAAPVLDALRRQNPLASSAGSLATLASGEAVVAVTGQQTGLFLGPLYVLHKAATAIRVARALAEETGRHVVPVFWLQTEDADFEEIRSTRLPDASRDGVTLTLGDALAAHPDGHRIPVAHRPLGASVDEALAVVEAIIGGDRHGDAVYALLRQHYRAEAHIPEAFAGLLMELFADHGLLVFDPRDPLLTAEAGRFFAQALEATPAVDAALQARVSALEAADFKAQVPVRPGASLLCFQPDSAEGPRYRLCADGDDFLLAGRADPRVSRATISDALRDDPRRFSTTALLRPAFQDFLLPTAAYVGGPGEIAYYAEMEPVYAGLGLVAPLIIPRARLRLVSPAIRRVAGHLGVDLSGPLDVAVLLERLTPQATEDLTTLRQAAGTAFDAYLNALAAATPALEGQDAGLNKATDRARYQVQRQLDRLDGRFGRARIRSDSMLQQRLDRLLGELVPDGAPQERVLNFATYAARVGAKALADAIVEAATPYEHQLKDVNL